jgi:hypothetical protein
MLLLRDVELTGTSELFLELLDGGSLLLDTVDDGLGHECLAHNVVALLRLRNMQLSHDGLSLLGVLGLQRKSMVNEDVARSSLDVGNTITGLVTHLDHVGVGLLGEGLDLLARLRLELGVLAEINLGKHNDEGLGLEQRLDGVEEADLLVNSITASLRNVHEEQDACVEMRQGSDSLHFDSVSLVELMVQNTGSINDLVASALMLGVTHEQTLRRESVRLNIDVSTSHVVDQTGLADVGETGQDESAGVRVNTGKSTQMLANLLEITQTRLELLDERAHTTESRSLELLASEQRVSVLQETHVISSDVVDDVLGLVDVTQSQLVMISIIQHVHEITVERMDVVQLGEAVDDGGELLVKRRLHELDLAHVELTDTRHVEACGDHSRRLTLSL